MPRKSILRDALVEVDVPGGQPVTTARGKHSPLPDLHREPDRVGSLRVANEQVHLGDLISRFRDATEVGLRRVASAFVIGAGIVAMHSFVFEPIQFVSPRSRRLPGPSVNSNHL
jgi:hypothetical protein